MNTLASKKSRSVFGVVIRYFSCWLLLCGVALLSSCATHNGTSNGADATAPQTDYMIGAGDALNVIVWRNPEVSMVVTVRPDGKISTPLVEDLVADGKTPTALAREIEARLSKYIQSPVVTVVVTSFSGPYQEQVRVIGQAAKPQALAYRQGMTLMDVIIASGGMTDFAAGNSATIIRFNKGQQQKINVRLDDLIKYGDISANVTILPGDILLIPQSFF